MAMDKQTFCATALGVCLAGIAVVVFVVLAMNVAWWLSALAE